MKLINIDCLSAMQDMQENSIDSIVTDPPYGINFLSKKWDYNIPSVETWKECLRVLKPGGHALIACGTRTQHRMVVNIEDAGFEIRDVITWLYGSGFPKSHNISKAIDKKFGAEIEYEKYKRNGGGDKENHKHIGQLSDRKSGEGYRPVATSDIAKQWDGWGTALKPACEFWTLARKPLSEKTVVDNVLKHGTGGINIDECRVELNGDKKTSGGCKGSKESLFKLTVNPKEDNTQGRFPANLILDEDINLGGASRFFFCAKASKSERNKGLEGMEEKESGGMRGTKDKSLKTGSGNERNNLNQNFHPTVKPQKLMEYLCKLITQANGTILDPFMGSGSTGVAAKNLEFNFFGIELNKEYFEIAEKRIISGIDIEFLL